MIYRQAISNSDLPLQKGSRGPAVVAIQQALLKAGYSLGKFGADGVFGRLTRRAVKRFQRDTHLPESKIVDAQTYTALMQAPPAQAPANQTSPVQVPPTQAPATTPIASAAQSGGIPQVDLGPKAKGRAYMLDWDSKHKEIEQNTTLREAFLANLEIQLASIFGKKISRDEVLQSIQQAEAAGNINEAEQLRIKLRIANQYAVVETLDVKESKRYEKVKKLKKGKWSWSTYCNIYAYDVVTAMGGYLPRVWWKDKALARIRKGEKVKPVYEETVHELSANALTDWMYEFGSQYGWRKEEDITAAQDAANQGKLIILLAANVNPRASGHVSVLMPESKQIQAVRENNKVVGVVQSQAGATNFKLDNHRKQWWKDKKHTLGAAWIFEGRPSSPLLSPDQLGYRSP
jgi:peptidoglycan hydrolase-like protein with peptidoglycan-binding domain